MLDKETWCEHFKQQVIFACEEEVQILLVKLIKSLIYHP